MTAVVQESVGGTGTNFTTSAATAVDDYIAVFQSTTTTISTQPGGTFTTGWTTGPDFSSLANGKVKSWYRKLTSGGSAVNVTVSSGRLYVHVIRGADPTTFLDDSDGTAGNGASFRTLPSMDAAGDERLLLAFWLNNHQSGSTDVIDPPAGMTEVAETTSTGTSNYVASQVVNAGSTGTHTPTFLRNASASVPSGCLGMLIRPIVVPVTASDSAVATDTASVELSTTTSDSAVASEAATLQFDVSQSDSAVGSESASAALTTSTADSAVVTETALYEIPVEHTPTDSALVGESAAITATFANLSDSAVIGETAEVVWFVEATDSAVGTESAGPINLQVTDSAVVTEFAEVIEFPVTNILPRPTRRLKYDLSVWAMVPQSSGPPAFIEIDPISWDKISYADVLGEPQELEVTCQAASLPLSIQQRLENATELPMELRLKRNGVTVFAGPPLGLQTDDENLTISCRGLLVYLYMMYVLEDLKYESAPIDQLLLVKKMVDAWQGYEYGNFGIDTSSIAASGVLRAISYLRDEEHNVGARVVDLGKMDGGFDAEVDPASRLLQLWSPFKGVDRSTGEDKVIIDKQSITSSNVAVSLSPSDVASLGIGTAKPANADRTLYSLQYNQDLRSRYGLRGYAATYDGVTTQAELDLYNAAALAARGRPLVVPGPKVRVTADVDLPRYAVGDTIECKLGGILRASGAFRLRKRKVHAEKSGKESVDLEFV